MSDDLSKYFDDSDDEKDELKFDEEADKSSIVLDENDSDDPDEKLESMFNKKDKKKGFEVKETSIPLSVENFKTFMSILRGIRFSCDDVIINHGIISQFNERKTFVFNVDLRSILGDTCLIINNLSTKFELLATNFLKQNVETILEVTEDSYVVRDTNKCNIQFKSPDFDLIDCSFLDEKDMNKITLKDTGRPIFEYTFKKMMISRIINSAKLLGSPSMRIIFEKDKASFIIQPLDSSNNTVVTVGAIEDELDDDSIENLLVTSKVQTFLNFLNAGCEEIDTEMHFRKTEDKSCCFKMSAEIPVSGTDLVVPFSIYSMMNFVDPEDYLS